ncbi:hypothetical protein BG015_005998 [Linnemannia schmuckeri]|uniref:Uncharacterized protein n=1 Tax=Linnemannia schmuckeri TaxID=64567 RepID=A0A9P5S120_9FUNG|nr:hypothetical protein BG015_005998 [Linnemannia schmuckeri]
MHFQAIIASVLVLASLAAAQAPPTAPTDPVACGNCLNKGAESLNANCAGLTGLTQPPNMVGQLTDVQKKCLCAIASSSTWLNECAKPEICGQAITEGLLQSYAALKTQVCPAGSVTAAGNTGNLCTGSKSAAAGFTVAAAAVLGALF